jgi:hypothetical protein
LWFDVRIWRANSICEHGRKSEHWALIFEFRSEDWWSVNFLGSCPVCVGFLLVTYTCHCFESWVWTWSWDVFYDNSVSNFWILLVNFADELKLYLISFVLRSSVFTLESVLIEVFRCWSNMVEDGIFICRYRVGLLVVCWRLHCCAF